MIFSGFRVKDTHKFAKSFIKAALNTETVFFLILNLNLVFHKLLAKSGKTPNVIRI